MLLHVAMSVKHDVENFDGPWGRTFRFPKLRKQGFELHAPKGVHKRPWVETTSFDVAVGIETTKDLRVESIWPIGVGNGVIPN